MITVPVYEMKNKLSHYLHIVEEQGPVAISVHGKPKYMIMTFEEYEKSSKKTFFETTLELRKSFNLEDDDFDYTEYFDSLRDRNYFGRPEDQHLFDEV